MTTTAGERPRKSVSGSLRLPGVATVLLVLVGLGIGAFVGNLGTAQAPSLGSGSGPSSSLGGSLSVRATIPGITDPNNPWIELDSWSWGASQSGSFALGPCPRGSPSRCEASAAVITKATDATSPKLIQYAMTGNPLAKVTVEFCRTSSTNCQEKYMVVNLQNAFISSMNWGGGNQEKLTESISFVFQTINIEYKDAKTGADTGGAAWDCSSWPECTRA